MIKPLTTEEVIRDIESVVCEYFALTPTMIHSDSRTHYLAEPRNIIFYLCTRRRLPSPILVGYFRRHRTAFIAAHRTICDRIAGNEALRNIVNRLELVCGLPSETRRKWQRACDNELLLEFRSYENRQTQNT